MNNKPTATPHSVLEMIIAKERLRQARYSFNAALTATVLSTCISLVGAALLLSGKVPEGTVTSSSAMVASVGCLKLAKDANDRLDKIAIASSMNSSFRYSKEDIFKTNDLEPRRVAMYEMVTMVFIDLVNSTAVKNHLQGSDITARNRIYRDTILYPHRVRVENTLANYGGRKVETNGDAFFLVFPNPIQALLWAVAIQKSHAEAPIPTPLGSLQLTIGMHTGSPLADDDEFIGQEVDYAARVAARASVGQILLSEVTATFIRDARIDGILLHCHGNRNLKGIGEAAIFEALYDNKQPQPLKE